MNLPTRGAGASPGLPPERQGRPAEAELIARRARFVGAVYHGPLPVTDRKVGGVECRVLTGGDDVCILYLHGGGYRMGGVASYTGYGARLASAGAATVVLVEYRLAPESPFPAGLHDAVAVHRALRAERPSRPIVVAGDSAGGGLAAGVVLAARRGREPVPDGIALLSPWLDLHNDSTYYRTGTDPLFDHATAEQARETYLQGHDPADELVSPLRADLTGFPPALVQVGTTETLLGDALSFGSALAGAGVECRLEIVAGRGHTWPLIEPEAPDSVAAIESVGRFARSRVHPTR